MKINFDIKTIIIFVLLILLSIGGWYHFNSNGKLNDRLKQQEKLTITLQDTIRVKELKNGELEYEKKTIQADLNDLENENLNLNDNQQKLLKEIKRISKEVEVISAAYVDMKVELKGLIDNDPVEIDSTSVRFANSTDSIEYDIKIDNVQPLPTKIPSLEFSTLSLPNEQVVSFNWGGKKDGYPVSLSIKNSNPFFKVNDVDSYAIPELTKEEVNPTFWQKVKKFPQKTSGKVTIFLLGLGTGAILSK